MTSTDLTPERDAARRAGLPYDEPTAGWVGAEVGGTNATPSAIRGLEHIGPEIGRLSSRLELLGELYGEPTAATLRGDVDAVMHRLRAIADDLDLAERRQRTQRETIRDLHEVIGDRTGERDRARDLATGLHSAVELLRADHADTLARYAELVAAVLDCLHNPLEESDDALPVLRRARDAGLAARAPLAGAVEELDERTPVTPAHRPPCIAGDLCGNPHNCPPPAPGQPGLGFTIEDDPTLPADVFEVVGGADTVRASIKKLTGCTLDTPHAHYLQTRAELDTVEPAGPFISVTTPGNLDVALPHDLWVLTVAASSAGAFRAAYRAQYGHEPTLLLCDLAAAPAPAGPGHVATGPLSGGSGADTP